MKGRDYMEDFFVPGGAGNRSVHASVKAEARQQLIPEGNRIKLIESAVFIALMMVAVGGITAAVWIPVAPLLENFTFIYDYLYEISVLIDYAIIFFFVFPAGYGMLTLSHRMISGENAPLALIFYAYRRLFRTWAVMIVSLVPATIIGGSVFGAVRLMRYINEELAIVSASYSIALMINTCVVLTAGILIAGALYLAVRGFFFPGFAMRGDVKVGKSLSAAFMASRGRMREIIAFVFSFSGWAALSLLTLGVIFIMQFVPFYTTSYMIYCGRIAITKDNS
jgi:hypothetical protein